MRHDFVVTIAVLAGLGGPLACSDSTPEEEDGTTGQAVYAEPQPDGNSFACATCHALSEPADDGLRRPGHPIGDALRRPSFKNGRVDSALQAVNSCLEEWMNAEPWSEDTEAWQMLQTFLEEQDSGSGEAPALTYEIVEPPANLDGGDADRGQQTFNETCAVCHGQDAEGTTRAPVLVAETLDADYIAERVRLSGSSGSAVYDGLTGGRMPFWSKDRLSDDELRDVTAYLLTIERTPDSGSGGTTGAGGGSGSGGSSASGGAGSGGSSNTGGPPPRDCDATHEKVGQMAVLEEKFHDVGGTATIVDDCTIEVTDFTYDGLGIVVEMYAGSGGDYTSGFAISGELTRDTPYEGETLTLYLPENKTLDDLDGLSVWCVDVAVSFGDGMFE